MGMVETKTFTTAAEIYANAAAVRERILRPNKAGPTDEDILREKVAKLEKKIEEQKAVIEKNEKMISRLLMDKSDLHGAILSQAHMLIDTFRASSGESEKVTRRSPRQIIEDVLSRYHPNVSFTDIVGPRRTRELIEPRHQCMAAVYTERKDLSLPQIARVFNRDHTTLLHACQKFGATRCSE